MKSVILPSSFLEAISVTMQPLPPISSENIQHVHLLLLLIDRIFMQAQVSFHRLEEFLKLGELQPDNVIRNMPSPHCKSHAIKAP